MHRCFIGFELASEIRSELYKAMRQFRRSLRDEKPRFLEADAYHVTLKFLGAVDNDRLGPLRLAIAQSVEQTPPIETSFAGYGALPKRSQGHVLVAVLRDDQGLALDLQQRTEAACVELGFPSETRLFKPHTTLARFRTAVDMRSALAAGQLPKAAVSLSSVALFESTLAPGGAKYSVIERFPLSGQALPEA